MGCRGAQTYETEPLPLRSDNIPVDSVRIELNTGHPAGIGDLLVVKIHHTFDQKHQHEVSCMSNTFTGEKW